MMSQSRAQEEHHRQPKPKLMELRRSYNQGRSTHLTSEKVAEVAGVPLWREYQIELGAPVPVEDAKKVLMAFSQLTGVRYNLSDVNLRLMMPTLQDHNDSGAKTDREGIG